MEPQLLHSHYDLVTPDGKILTISSLDDRKARVEVRIEGISPAFVGWGLEADLVFFNLKSTLAQIGIDSTTEEISLDRKRRVAEIRIILEAIGGVAEQMLKLLEVGTAIGKLFAADPSRRVRDPDYLLRMFGRSDGMGRPLLSLGGREGGRELVFEVVEGRTVAYISLREGRIEYDEAFSGFLPTIARGLKASMPVRDMLALHQQWVADAPRTVEPGRILLVKTVPLHVRTVFASVVNELLPRGFRHTTASVLQPDTMHSGDIYELHGTSTQEITDIPLEFYTLEPHREYVFFSDRDQLQASLDDPQAIFRAFNTAPTAPTQTAVFIAKGSQMEALTDQDWVAREPIKHEFPGITQGTRQALMVERYIEQQAATPFLTSIEEGLITSQGVLFCRYFPSPVLKRMFLSDTVHRCLKGIYFQSASATYGDYFSFEDRALLVDLAKFGIPVYWANPNSNQILLYVPRPDKDCGMFVPIEETTRFQRATFFGLYGSNLIAGDFEEELTKLLEGIIALKETTHHPLLNPDTPLAMVTGGGPGVMEIGNKVAQKLELLSCANILDFRPKDGTVVNEQKQNPYVDLKMTYRLDKLVERQSEFHLDFPIFLMGGIGTDFEYALEEVRRKTGIAPLHPVLLLGEPDYWRQKITSRYQCNVNSGTIKGSEWVANTFFCARDAEEALKIYRAFFEGNLKLGPTGPTFDEGFVSKSN